MRLHDYFGRGANEVMHRLRAIRDRVLAAGQDTGDTPAPAPDAIAAAGPVPAAAAPVSQERT